MELPDLGPEDALTYYDYLKIAPDEVDSSIILQAYNEESRKAQEPWLRAKLNEALQILNDPFRRVEYDNFVAVQRKYRFGGNATVQIKTPVGESTEPVKSLVFTDANFSYLFWQDTQQGNSLTGKHLCVELLRIQEVTPGPNNAVNLVLNNGEILIFSFEDKRSSEDFGAAIRFSKMAQQPKRKTSSVVETNV